MVMNAMRLVAEARQEKDRVDAEVEKSKAAARRRVH